MTSRMTARLDADNIVLRCGIEANTLEGKRLLLAIHRYLLTTLYV